MVEKANAKGGDAFIKQYSAESEKLAEASAEPKKLENICADIKEWYGPLGSRIADLLHWQQEARGDGKAKSTTGDSAKKGKHPSVQW